MRGLASRRRYQDYRRELRERRAQGEFEAGRAHGSEPPASGVRHRGFRELYVEFLRLLRGHRAALAAALATVTVSTLLKLIPPASTKFVVDTLLAPNSRATPLPDILTRWLPADRYAQLWWVAGAVVGLSVVETAIHIWGRWLATRTTKRVQVDVRRRVFEHAVRLPLVRVYQLKSGGASSLLRDDAGGVAELVFSMLYNPWRAVVQLLGSLVILAFVDWRLLAGALLLGPLVWLTHRTWIGRIRPLYRDIRKQRQEIDGQATEVFGGMRVVRAFGRQQSETGRFQRGTHFQARQELGAWWWARIVELVWETLIPLASAALLVYGGYRVLDGALSLGDLMMFLAYLAMLLGPLAVLANSATQFQGDLAGLDRVLDVLSEPMELPTKPGARMLREAEVAGRITLRGVSFRYPGTETDVLREVDLEIAAGQTIALVGPSGAGKTTLCNLIARFYDPTSGVIEIDGLDLREVDLQSYRGLLGVVEQDVFLFDGTVAENIAYARRHASREAVRAAADSAGATEFIEQLPHGYETRVGERGVKLSGGQRQRLAIARAILADPRILILDEATSNLDTQTERLIQNSLTTLLRGRTSLVIAHRLSTITHADRILVVEAGQIVESGTHEQLMNRSGRYRHMVQLQTGEA